jgi:hypothetical protein
VLWQNYAQKLVNADRASIFLLDRKNRELYARIFDVGSGSGLPSVAQHKEIRFESPAKALYLSSLDPGGIKMTLDLL